MNVLCQHPIACFEAAGAERIMRRIGDVAEHIRRVESAGVHRVDHDVGARGAVDEIGWPDGIGGRYKSRRNKNHDPLARHAGQLPDRFLEAPVRKFRMRVSCRKGVRCGRLRQRLRLRYHVPVALESALDGVFCGHRQRLGVSLHFDQIGLVVPDFGTTMLRAPETRAWNDSQERFAD